MSYAALVHKKADLSENQSCEVASVDFFLALDVFFEFDFISNMSHLEAHAGFFRLLKKWIFDPYVLQSFDKKLIS